MPDKPQLPKFAEIIPTGTVAIICGVGSIRILFQNLVIACVVGIVGIAIGFATLKMKAEKLDKIFAVIGIRDKVIPIIYTLVILVKK